MRKYESPITLGPSWMEMVFGVSEKNKQINRDILRESRIEHFHIVTDQMSGLCDQLNKDLDKIDNMKRKSMSSLKTLDKSRNTPTKEDIMRIIFDYDVSMRSINGKCDMIYETVGELKRLLPREELETTRNTIDSFQELAEDIQMKLSKMKEELTSLLEKSIIEEEGLMEKERKESEVFDTQSKSRKFFGDFEQKYVNENPIGPIPSSAPPGSVPPQGSRSTPISPGTSSVKLIPNKYFRNMVKRYLGKDMKTPVADPSEIKKCWQKVSLHVGANSTKYQKLSSTEQKEADEIFKKITSEKDLYVPKSSGKRKKATKKKKKPNKKKKKATKKK